MAKNQKQVSGVSPPTQHEHCHNLPRTNFSQPSAGSLPVDYSEIPLSILPSFLSAAYSESAANQSGT